MKKLDNLFQQKLINHAVKPSDTAWEKIHAQIKPRKEKGWIFYLSVAASIVLAISIGMFLYPTRPAATDILITNNQQSLPNEGLEEKLLQPKLPEQPVVEKDNVHEEFYQIEIKEEEKKNLVEDNKHDYQNKDIIPFENEIIEPLLANQANQVGETDPGPEIELKNISPEQVASIEKSKPVIRITYKRSEVVSSEPLHLEEKDRTLEKMIVFAQDIKNSGFGLSDLRQAKDQLLDIDFRRSDTKFRNN